MIIVRAFCAPWVATQPASTRWTVTIALLLDLAAAIAAAVFDAPMAGVMVLLIGIGLLWVFALPSMLWLTQAANRLRLPAIRRDVNVGLVLWALVSMAAPAVLVIATGGRPLAAILLAALVGSLCLLYAILPWILAVGICLVPILASQVLRALHLAAPSDPGFVGWAAPVAGVLVLVAVWRWQRLQRRENLLTYHLLRPLMIGFSRTMLSLASNPQARMVDRVHPDPTQRLRQRPNWMQPLADLRRTGPAFPCRSLRVALGGSYLPQRWTRRWRTALVTMLVAAAIVVVWGPATLYTLGDFEGNAAGASVLVGVNVVLALVAAIVPVGFAEYLQILWRRPNAELPLLALLPRLAPAGKVNRVLLAAILGKPLVILAVLWILSAGVGVLSHLSAGAMALVLIVPVLSAAWLAVSMASMMARSLGRSGRRVFEWVSIPVLLVLACLGAGLAPHFPGSVEWLALAWLAWVIFIAAIALRAWHHLTLRPHPFLP